ncbi:MAG: hypothetical protein HC941_28960 [Microcoleus sp. SU_5_3]|nr:hypothetical protein [Microcoleus sp. SU_5_3]
MKTVDLVNREKKDIQNTNDSIVREDLKIQNMVKNHHLAKSISYFSWVRFT